MTCCRGADSRGYSPSFASCEGSEKLKVDFSPQARGESWRKEEEKERERGRNVSDHVLLYIPV